MKTAIAGIIILIIVAAGGWYVWMTMNVPAPSAEPSFEPPSTTGPVNSASSSPSTETGPSTEKTGDGSTVQQNLTLGTDSTPAFSKYLIGYTGHTLYYFTRDHVATSSTDQSVSNCYDQCAQIWPPYTIPAGMQINLQAGVTGHASTITRADGTTQVVYDGHPLYFYSGDKAGSDLKGEGLDGVWFVIQA